jgi:hypothetical protein
MQVAVTFGFVQTSCTSRKVESWGEGSKDDAQIDKKNARISSPIFGQFLVSQNLRPPNYCTNKSLRAAFLIEKYLQSGSVNMAPKELNFITGNKNKLTEVQAILGDVVHLQSQSLDLVEIQGTIEDVSTDKCRRATELVYFLDSKS